MRIFAILTDAFGAYGGISQYNCDFLSALSQSPRVQEVVVLPRNGSYEHEVIPAKIQQLPSIKSKGALIFAACVTATRKGPFDVLFCGHINYMPLASVLAKTLGVPVWLQSHGVDAWNCPSPALRAAAERCALITAVSRYTRQRIPQWADMRPSRVRVLPNTVRPIFSPGPVNETVLKKCGVLGKKLILTVSRISKEDEYKGHDLVIKALPSILKAHPDAVYVVVGDGDGREKLENLTSQLGLQPYVRFLGRLSNDDVLALYRFSSVFIMPSWKERFGIVFVEAAATGLPVIGGNCDGSCDALADGQIGCAINPRSSSEIVGAITGVLDRPFSEEPVSTQRFAFANFAAHVDELVSQFSNKMVEF